MTKIQAATFVLIMLSLLLNALSLALKLVG